MDNKYTECCVKKKTTTKDTMLKLGMIALIIAAFAAGVLFHFGLFLLVGIFGIVFAYICIPMLNVTYEYVYCDGQIDFDKIMNGEKRKHIYRTDLENIKIVAPDSAHELDSYKYNNTPVRDFSSHEKDHKKYAIVESQGEKLQMLLFEPDEKMLSMMARKAPHKVIIQ